MPDQNLPLSGAVTQAFNAWSSAVRSVSGQFGLVNINLARSSNPALEAELVSEVASYGSQLGRISNALAVLVAQLPDDPRRPVCEQAAIDEFKRMLNDLAAVKDRHAKPGKPRALRFRSRLGTQLETGEEIAGGGGTTAT